MRDNESARKAYGRHLDVHRMPRVRMPLSRGHMDLNLSPDASPETVEALRALGEAALDRMTSTTADLGSAPASRPVSGSMSSGGETL